MLNLGTVEPGETIYIPFGTYASADGASITMSGLAVTDIEVYKDGSVTQRSDDAGYTLLDTDGIDFDGITGIHGFSINLADNTVAGFWAAGSRYFVVVSAITVDTETVNFVAATFKIGYSAAILNTTIATLSSQTSFTLTAGPAEDDALNGHWVVIHDVASAVQKGTAIILDYTGASKTVTLAAGTTFTAAATDNISVMGKAPLQPTVAGRTLDVTATGAAGIDWGNVENTGSTITFAATTFATVSAAGVTSIDSTSLTAIAAAVWQDAVSGHFTTASSIGKSLYTAGVVPGAAGGLFIAGSNAATTMATFTVTGAVAFGAAFDITGTFTIADGIVANRSTANSTAVTFTGSGTGHGFRLNGGSTSGNGIRVLGGGSGAGGHIQGGATGNALNVVGGATSGNGIVFTVTTAATDMAIHLDSGDLIIDGNVDIREGLSLKRTGNRSALSIYGSLDATNKSPVYIFSQVAGIANIELETTTNGNAFNVTGLGSGAFLPANCITAAAAASDFFDEIWDEVVDVAVTARQSLQISNAACGGKASGLATATATYRNPGDSVNRIVSTVDADGNRSAVTITYS